jgi:hypothetical protein
VAGKLFQAKLAERARERALQQAPRGNPFRIMAVHGHGRAAQLLASAFEQADDEEQFWAIVRFARSNGMGLTLQLLERGFLQPYMAPGELDFEDFHELKRLARAFFFEGQR